MAFPFCSRVLPGNNVSSIIIKFSVLPSGGGRCGARAGAGNADAAQDGLLHPDDPGLSAGGPPGRAGDDTARPVSGKEGLTDGDPDRTGAYGHL